MKHSERHTTIQASQYATNNLIEITKPSPSAGTSTMHGMKHSVLSALRSKGMLSFLEINKWHSLDDACSRPAKKQRTKLMIISKDTLPHINTKNAICINGYKLNTPVKKK